MSGVDAGTIYSEVRIKLDKLSGDVQKMSASFDKVVNNSDANSKKVKKSWTDSFKKIGLAGVAMTAGLVLAFKSMITNFARTEQSLANVAAVTNATAEEFQLLKDAADSAGQTTRFRASEAADALFYLASAGFDATQSIEALDGVLLLAGATGSDLSQSAQTVTATLSQFNLTAKESADVVNIFAAANSNSQATLSRLQNALRQVGPVAGGMNKTLEETVGVLQLLFNAGFEGEMAGRGLKSALADLGNESSIAVQKLGDLGIAYDTINPATNSLADVFGVLKDAGLDVTDALDIFGKVAGPQVSILIKEGKDSIDAYTNAVTGTNEAARQYAVQNDTLAGSFDKFKSALEGSGNSIIETLVPALRGILDAAAAILNIFTSLPAPIKGLVAGFGTVTTAVLAGSKALTLLGVSASASLGPIALVAGAIGGLAILGTQLANQAKEKAIENQYKDLASQMKILNSEAINTVEAIKDFSKQTGYSLTTSIQIADEQGLITDEIREQVNLLKAKALAEGEVQRSVKETIELRDKVTTQLKSNLITLTVFNKANRTGIEAAGELEKALADLKEKNNLSSKEMLRYIENITVSNETAQKYLDAYISRLKSQVSIQESASEYEEEQANKRLEAAREEQRLTAEKEAAARAEAQAKAEALAKAEAEADEALKAEEQRIKDRIKLNEEYTKKLEEFGLSRIELLELERKRAIEEAERTGADVLRIKEYYDLLLQELETEQRESKKAIAEKAAEEVKAAAEIALAEKKEQDEKDIADEQEKADKIKKIREQLIFSSISLAKTLFSVLSAGRQKDLDDQISKIQEQVDNEIITKEEGDKKIAQLEYKKALATWTAQGGTIAADIITGIARALSIADYIGAGFIGAEGIALGIKHGIEKPKPPQLATGAVILPKNGGVSTIQAENGYPEVSANLGPKGDAVIQELGRRVAEAGGSGGYFNLILNIDGQKIAGNTVHYINNGIVELDI